MAAKESGSRAAVAPNSRWRVKGKGEASDGNAAIEFYKNAFGAEEVMRMPGAEGKGVGHRAGGLEDPFGHHWYFATRKEIVSDEEMAKRPPS